MRNWLIDIYIIEIDKGKVMAMDKLAKKGNQQPGQLAEAETYPPTEKIPEANIAQCEIDLCEVAEFYNLTNLRLTEG